MLTGTAYLYANCRVSTENRNKWAGIIKWFSAWTHFFHDLLEAQNLWTRKCATVLLRYKVTLDLWVLQRRIVENSENFKYETFRAQFKACFLHSYCHLSTSIIVLVLLDFSRSLFLKEIFNFVSINSKFVSLYHYLFQLKKIFVQAVWTCL
jgi:hypothetical protein